VGVVVENIFGKYLKILSQLNCDSYLIIKNITLQIMKKTNIVKDKSLNGKCEEI